MFPEEKERQVRITSWDDFDCVCFRLTRRRKQSFDHGSSDIYSHTKTWGTASRHWENAENLSDIDENILLQLRGPHIVPEGFGPMRPRKYELFNLEIDDGI